MLRLGLRARVAAALVVTAAVALGVAALALLSPLERNLRSQGVRELSRAGVQSRPAFASLSASDARELRLHLRRAVRHVASITGAHAALLDSHRRVIVDTDPDDQDPFSDFAAALDTNRPVRRILMNGPTPTARVALRVMVNDHRYVLALRKPLTDQADVVGQVRRAFLTAAAAALLVAILLAAVIAATVGRRLGRLRAAVRRFGVSGHASDLPHTRATDEVGDLTRAFEEMAAQLEHEEALRRDFVATASHELRTPLMSLQGRLELLSDELERADPDLEDGRAQLADARAQAERLSNLAADLLDLSRLDAGVELRREPVDVAEIVRAVSAEFGARAARQATRIDLDLEPHRVEADPGATARILRIVLDNALRVTGDGDPIEVAVSAEGSWVRLSVTDHGGGIPAGDRERIFRRFVRGANPNQSGGFGLGLAIGRELSARMGGRLVLERSDESGSVFGLWLPSAPNGIPTSGPLAEMRPGEA